MKRRKIKDANIRISPPGKTPESRENQMIAMAMDLTERRLREGTATSQEIVHFLKLGSTRNQAEDEILRLQTELIRAKTENLQSQKRVEELYKNALDAMRSYSGSIKGEDGEDAI